MTKRSLLLLTWLAAGLTSPVLAQPVGPEFQVNTYTPAYQRQSAVASNATGDFVVVWESFSQDGSDTGVFGQRYDRVGTPLGDEFQVNVAVFDDQNDPSVALDGNGAFVVVWRWGGCVRARRYDSGGNSLGGEFLVGCGLAPSVTSDQNGAFVVVWNADGDGNDDAVLGRRYDSDGNPLGVQFVVNTYTTNRQTNAAVASDASGNFVVVWQSVQEDVPEGVSTGIFGQRYNSDGNPLGGEFHVNTYMTNTQSVPAVALAQNGTFVVVWESKYQDGGGGGFWEGGVFGQLYDGDGERIGTEFQVNTYTTEGQIEPTVASDQNGNFVVVWRSYGGQDGGLGGIFGQRYNTAGNPLGDEFQVNTYTSSDQSNPSVASNATGDFIVTWESNLQDGDNDGIFGQRFSAGCEASVQVQREVNTTGITVPVQVHIAHGRPETVTVRWKLTLLDASGQVVAKHISPPHTFKFGDVLDQEVNLPLPDDLASGEYTLDLAVKQMAGTQGARATLRVVRAE